MTEVEIRWHGFLGECCNRQHEDEELGGWIFADAPLSPRQRWEIYQVATIGMDFDRDGFCEGFRPEPKDLRRVMLKARALEPILIGNVHTHPRSKEFLKHGFGHAAACPSEIDLSSAQQFDQVVRIVLSIDYMRSPPAVADWVIHDMFGRYYKIERSSYDRTLDATTIQLGRLLPGISDRRRG